MLIEAIRTIEQRENRPVYQIEVQTYVLKEKLMDPSEITLLRIQLYNVFKSDLVLCDAECNRFSLNMELQRNEETNPDGVFEHCSDRIERLFPTYLLDDEFHFIPGPLTPTINFDNLKALLLSTD